MSSSLAIALANAFTTKDLANDTIDAIDYADEADADAHARANAPGIPGLIELNSINAADEFEKAQKTEDFNARVMELCVLNALDAYRANADRHASNPSQYPLSGATFFLSKEHFFESGFPCDDPEKIVKHIMSVGKAYGFNPGERSQANAVLSTYHVLKRFLTDVMKEFALLVRTPSESLIRDATGLLISHITGEFVEWTTIGDDAVWIEGMPEGPDAVSIEDVERTALYFYNTVVNHPETKKLMELAQKFAPIDVTIINRRTYRTPRKMFLSAGIKRERDGLGDWLPECPLNWSQLLLNQADTQTIAAPRDTGAAW